MPNYEEMEWGGLPSSGGGRAVSRDPTGRGAGNKLERGERLRRSQPPLKVRNVLVKKFPLMEGRQEGVRFVLSIVENELPHSLFSVSQPAGKGVGGGGDRMGVGWRGVGGGGGTGWWGWEGRGGLIMGGGRRRWRLEGMRGKEGEITRDGGEGERGWEGREGFEGDGVG